MGDFRNGVSGNAWRPTDFSINFNSGNVGIGKSRKDYMLIVHLIYMKILLFMVIYS